MRTHDTPAGGEAPRAGCRFLADTDEPSPTDEPPGADRTSPVDQLPGPDELLVIKQTERPGEPAVLHRYDAPADPRPRPVPGTRGLWRTAADGVPDQDKAVRRAFQRVRALGAYFGAGECATGPDALIVQSRRDRAHKAVFAGAEFRGSRHRLHIKGARKLTGTAKDAERAELVSGVCLFSHRNLRFVDEHGDCAELLRADAAPPAARLRSVTVEDELSLYEYETVLRQSRVIGDVAAMLPPSLPLTVTVDVPRVQYYLYLLDAYQGGLVTTELAQRYFRLVDSRYTRVLDLFRRRIRRALDAAGRTDVAVRTAPGLDPLAECLAEAVATGDVPHDDDLLAVMIATGDPMWKELRELDVPHDRHCLGYTSYLVELLRAVGLSDDGRGALGINVDSFGEALLFDQARQLRQELDAPDDDPPFLGLYAAETVQTLRPDGHVASLYLTDPGRYALGEDGVPVDLFRLLDGVYAQPSNAPPPDLT
ncbi:hypothetical protein GCM10018785_46770 [Streptomyces longispororuber]|uniref:Uncharacterized protein n=1 Tax=Streptomyces longispororuber TaxID=68230 RepID=A0A918ZW30_9ACTN|nr:hypothetical protein [Streptomyces longispororuber]GHE73315.1 hypothetical protein GCM10018785_46770 [Streptomyces longispororuber]